MGPIRTLATAALAVLAPLIAIALGAGPVGADGGETMAPASQPPAPDGRRSAPRPGKLPETLPAGLPAGAVAFAPGIYLVPAGTDASGCTVYAPYSPTGAVLTVLYYEDGAGGFTTDRAKAACPR